jgi:hypothetical protein
VAGSYEHGNDSSDSKIRLGISWLAVWLSASEVALCCMELLKSCLAQDYRRGYSPQVNGQATDTNVWKICAVVQVAACSVVWILYTCHGAEQSPSREADSHLAGQETFLLLCSSINHATEPWPDPDEFTSHPQISRLILILSSHMRPGPAVAFMFSY